MRKSHYRVTLDLFVESEEGAYEIESIENLEWDTLLSGQCSTNDSYMNIVSADVTEVVCTDSR